jgi:phospholipase/carboxylesterase
VSQNGPVSLTFLAREASADRIATLVLLHGLGADENDLMGLAPYLDSRLKIVCPRAPLQSPWGGYSWFATDVSEEGLSIDEGDARNSLGKLKEFLESLEGPILLGGFSQGAMMSLGILLEHGNLVEGVVGMSGGWLPCFAANALQLKPVLMTHGRQDPLVPFSFGQTSAQRLTELGLPVEFRAYNMPHTISEECLDDVSEWVLNWLENLTNSK